jgi:hypothetical protein
MMVFHMPEDPAWLQAFGRVAIVHAQLDHILRMLVKSLAWVTVEVAMDAAEREGSAILRERIRKLAKARLGEGRDLILVQALVERCRRATETRNEWTHNIIGRALDGTQGEWGPLPTAKEMDALTETMYELIGEINAARLGGWLAQALSKSSPLSQQG